MFHGYYSSTCRYQVGRCTAGHSLAYKSQRKTVTGKKKKKITRGEKERRKEKREQKEREKDRGGKPGGEKRGKNRKERERKRQETEEEKEGKKK